nr:hypothetical protein [uncultured Marinifilum sp.]
MKTNLKKLASLLMITVSIITGINIAQAQQRGQQGPPPTPNSSQIKKMVTELSNTLDLNADQTKEISDIFTDHFKEVKEKFESGRPSRKVMENLEKEFEKEVKSLLNDEQQEQFEAFIKKNKPQQQRGQRPNR